MGQKHRFKTTAILRSSVFKPAEHSIALANKVLSDNSVLKQSGHKLLPQSDLLYVRSVLVTAGMNHNDDVFYVKELWDARYTPILKPMNWGHNENEIVGVIYNVVARDLATGDLIPMDQDSYDQPFELITESVVYKLLFPQRAEEIIQKSQADELFVSMETWFDDYNYAVFQDDKIVRVIQRESATAFLDESLRANGGPGQFDLGDGDTGRIGRGLLKLCFGGEGFVDCPANDRSVIEAVGDDQKSADDNRNQKILKLLNMLETQESSVVSVIKDKEVEDMSGEKVIATKAEVKAAIEEHDAEKAAANEMVELRSKAEKAEALEAEVSKLRSAVNAINSKLDGLLQGFTDTMKVVTKTLAEGGASVDTPPEITKIDNADSVESKFNAKIAWIEQSKAFFEDTINKLNVEALSAKDMKQKLDEIAWAEKEKGIKELLSKYVGEEVLNGFLAKAKEMQDEEFTSWIDEKKTLVEGVKAQTEKEEMKEEDKEKKKKENKDKKESEGSTEAEAEESTESKEDAEAKVEEALENVEVENKPAISNASHEDSKDEDPLGMKAVAAAVYPLVDEKEDLGDKPRFDPVE